VSVAHACADGSRQAGTCCSGAGRGAGRLGQCSPCAVPAHGHLATPARAAPGCCAAQCRRSRRLTTTVLIGPCPALLHQQRLPASTHTQVCHRAVRQEPQHVHQEPRSGHEQPAVLGHVLDLHQVGQGR
jgi:hypothetical protein